MGTIAVKYVDIYPLRRVGDTWELLVLRRAPGTRCTGAWEVVHGHVELDERPAAAAERELTEETGFAVERLYNLSRVETFYRHTTDEVALIPVFVAMVAGAAPRLSAEHDAHEWLPLRAAAQRLAWPRSARAIEDIERIFAGVDAGALEDVLRIW